MAGPRGRKGEGRGGLAGLSRRTGRTRPRQAPGGPPAAPPHAPKIPPETEVRIPARTLLSESGQLCPGIDSIESSRLTPRHQSRALARKINARNPQAMKK